MIACMAVGDELQELQAWLARLKASGVLVVVEGKKDKAALASLGIMNTYSIEGPKYMVVESLTTNTRMVALLTDLDPEGKKLYGQLKSDLSQNGIQVDDRFREFLFRKTRLRVIEGLPKYIRTLEESQAKNQLP